jgi:predicted nuclease of restriction endonuclease-like (RecB) superfamily
MRRTQIQLPDDTFARAKELGLVRKISFANFEALSADEAVRDPLVLEFLNLRRHCCRPLRTRHA